MNPAQLLEPKSWRKDKAKSSKPRSKTGITRYGPTQSRKPDVAASHNNVQLTPKFDPQVLLNPRAGSAQNSPSKHGQTDRLAQNYSHSPDELEYDQPGQASFLERMHNVQRRQPQAPIAQKRKRDTGTESSDEDGSVKPKAKFNSSLGSGGTLSEHLKKEREDMGATSGPIDLTKEDEDLQVIAEQPVTEPVHEEICLGMISAKAHMHRIPFVSARSLSAIGPTHWPRTKVEYRRVPNEHNVIDLHDRTGKRFGKLDPQTSLALCPLLDRPDLNKIRCSIWLDSRPRQSDETVGAAVSIYASVSIIIHARRASADKIGRYLSQRQIFLSPPFGSQASGREFENPQVPKDFNPRASSNRLQSTQMTSTMTRTVEEMRRDAGNMIDSLIKHEDLPEIEADSRFITTPLLSHQKQGLYFLTDHERPDHDASFSLWKENLKNNGDRVWYHVITGHEVTERPPSIQGGILADMMGLGKTLSILSLIAATRAEAGEFGKTKPNDEHEANMRATLIICPKSVMSNWHEQIKAHTRAGTFSVYSYHGANREQSSKELGKFHIVLTTYNTAAAELNRKGRILASVNWFRIVLDEAHQIRNLNTGVSKACCALSAQRRWAVTGTPVQNALNDLGALIKFLRVRPFDESQAWAQYITAPFRMANTDAYQHLRLLVDSITLRRVKDSIDLSQRSEKQVYLDFSDEERRVYARVAIESNRRLRLMTGGSDKALKGKSYAHVLKSIGRMRMLCAHGLDMLNEEDRKEVVEGMDPNNAIFIDLGDEPALGEYQFVSERSAYETLHMMIDSDVNRCIKCDRRIGELEGKDDDESQKEGEEESGSSADDTADNEEDDVVGHLTSCYHLVCPLCKPGHDKAIKPNLTEDERYVCQYCETYVRYGSFELRRRALSDFVEARSAKIKNSKSRRWDESNYNGPSTKVKALIEDLKVSLEESRQLGPGETPIRSVVFSGWTTYLSLIEVALEDNGIGFARLDGTMSIKARTAVLTQFKTDPSIVVLLVSIKAGGQGLNLTAANKVYMMEPQFNPGVEQQAIDRVHRLGQTRNVHVTHYIIKDSVEEGIQKLQRKKEELANLSLNRKMSAVEVQKKKLEDLKELFK